MPHGIAATYAARLREARPEAVVVDLSGDLRLPTAESYKQWYGHDHKAPHLIGQAVFGLCEAYRDRLRGARLVSNPGCYATSVLLPLIPLLREGLVDPADIVADAKSGATGRRAHAARGPPLLRGGRGLLGLLAGPHAPPRGRDRGGPRRPHRAARSS